jgi:hypothetical protein
MSTNAAIMRRLDALEARLAPPAVDDGALERVMAELDRMAERMRAQSWPDRGTARRGPRLDERDTSVTPYQGSIGSAASGRRPRLGERPDDGVSGLTPPPTMRVHDPSGVATHGVALWSAGDR